MENTITNVNDLNINTDIHGLFDHTLNAYSKDALSRILLTPLPNVDAIHHRQDIIRGFLCNQNLLEKYHYNGLDFNYVHAMLTAPDSTVLNLNFKLSLFLHKEKRNATKGIYIHFILFLERLYSMMVNYMDVNTFPEDYKNEINVLRKYFLHYDIDNYCRLIRENKFKIAQVVALKKKINELQEIETKQFFECLFRFEALLSISITIHQRDFSFPTIGDQGFSLSGLYHPLLPEPILNSLAAERQVVLITGPNMAGKSTFLKAVAIAVYLGHLGLAVPAHEAKFPFFTNFCVHFNHTDNLQQGNSHFFQEVKNLKEVVLAAAQGEPVFAIFDELFKGTNVHDALQITRATIEGLSSFRESMFFISTHMDELKDMASSTVDSYYLDCTLTEGIPKFSYQLKKGWSSVQIGKILFKNEGLYDIFQAHGAKKTE